MCVIEEIRRLDFYEIVVEWGWKVLECVRMVEYQNVGNKNSLIIKVKS